MTFLELTPSPTFNLQPDFPWVADALRDIEKMIAENEVEPELLLTKFKKFEEVLNTDKKALQKELFEFKPPVVEVIPEDPKKKPVVIETPRSGETDVAEGVAAAAEEVVEEEEVYVKPAGKQSLEDIRE
jgi:hypothetical protein